jgi:signal transduction histidine kinase
LGDLKTRFVSMASHEFRTPLSTILSSASLASKYITEEDQEKRDKHIGRIKSAVSHLTEILNDFLSIEKIEDGNMIANYSIFNLKELLTSIINELTGIVKPDQEIIYIHQGGQTITLDHFLLRNIMINLLSNAIKFSPENSKIKVDSKFKNGQIEIRIKDSGIGISIKDKEHLFERFFRASNVTNIQGTGLGLHIVGRYVELLNGEIKYTSELEKGSTFTIKLPSKITKEVI